MHPALDDTVGLGIVIWLIGYFLILGLYYSPFASSMSWIILAVSIPVTIVFTWWWFTERGPHSLQYYTGVGIAWLLIVTVLDYLFIVLLFNVTNYYGPDVFLYYTLMLVSPVGVGWYLNRAYAEAQNR